MFDANKMTEYLMAGRKAVKTDAPAPVKSGLQTLSEGFKALETAKQEEAKADE